MRGILVIAFLSLGILSLCILSTNAASPLAVAENVAQDKPTSLSDARAAVEANIKTATGKAFDEQFGNDFLANHLAPLRQCKPRSSDDLRSFWILVKLDKDGTAREILFYPETKLGLCAHDGLIRGKFVAPPRDGYWVSVYMKVGH